LAKDRPKVSERKFGAWFTSGSSQILSLLLRADYDYVGIDCQHSAIDESEAARLLLGTNNPNDVPIVVRVSANRPELIGRVLDAGADGVIVPMVENARDAQSAGESAHYPPHGTRSYGRYGDTSSRQDFRAFPPKCIAMIETEIGMTHLEEIAAADHLGGLYLGPADLGYSTGIGPEQFPPTGRLLDMAATVVQIGHSSGKLVGVHAATIESAKHYISLGFDFYTLSTDRALLTRGALEETSTARSMVHGEA
jgi:2-keto-3-deoxy-L-rhamnonate aldolase RhmA